MKKILILIISLIIINVSGIVTAEGTPNIDKNEKSVYLTFDDGPSLTNTDKILDILSKNKVKATFCLIGENVELNRGTTRRINNLNMGIIPHCYCHRYNQLYQSVSSYSEDLKKCICTINDTLGEDKQYNMVRIPGGSSNCVCNCNILKDIKEELKDQDIYYVDWTIDSGDTNLLRVESSVIENNILKDAGKHSIDVVLMHDMENKDTTTKALQDIITIYKELGYEFKTLDDMKNWELESLINRKVINR